jgi:hypothetical protein
MGLSPSGMRCKLSSLLLLFGLTGLLPRATRGCSYADVGCHKDSAARLLKYHLSGCPTDGAWNGEPAPGQGTAPRCEPAKVSKEYCAEQCDRWRPWGGGQGAFYVGLESGVGVPNARPGYAECACDLAILGGGAPIPATECPAKCPGAAPGSTERCGGAPGSWSINIYRVDCTGSVWGTAFVLTVVIASALYVGGGVAYNYKTNRAVVHPHHEQWRALQGLVRDGVVFSYEQLRGKQHIQRRRKPRESFTTLPGTPSPRPRKKSNAVQANVTSIDSSKEQPLLREESDEDEEIVE